MPDIDGVISAVCGCGDAWWRTSNSELKLLNMTARGEERVQL